MAKKKVLVVGGGFGGVFAAKALERLGRGGKLEVELVNANNYFVFQPLLPEVAASSIHSADAVVPLRQLLHRLQVRQAEVMGIDFDREEGDRRARRAARASGSPLRRARHRARHRRRSQPLPRTARARAHHEGPGRRAPLAHPRHRLPRDGGRDGRSRESSGSSLPSWRWAPASRASRPSPRCASWSAAR